MKLLIITQAVDRRDTTLGFFHRWIEEFSRRVEKVEVITLRKGDYNFPKNVRVFSLNKEKIESRITKHEVRIKKIQYIFNFYKYIWKLRNEYDVVFVHMNQEYVVLGGLLWKLWNKKIFFWRNHPHGDFFTRIAIFFSDKVFYTSDKSFTVKYKKSKMMPAGIDTNIFQRDPNVVREKNSLLVFGRIAPIKKIELAIDTLTTLSAKGISCSLSIVGDTLPKDYGYSEILKDRVEMAGVSNLVHFEKGVRFENAPAIYQRHEIILNFTSQGSFDKTVIEALACGMKVLVSNQSMKNILPDSSITNGDIGGIVAKIENFLNFDSLQSAEYAECAKEIVHKQSLDILMEKIFECIPSEINGDR